jgi:hypothetical protein
MPITDQTPLSALTPRRHHSNWLTASSNVYSRFIARFSPVSLEFITAEARRAILAPFLFFLLHSARLIGQTLPDLISFLATRVTRSSICKQRCSCKHVATEMAVAIKRLPYVRASRLRRHRSASGGAFDSVV